MQSLTFGMIIQVKSGVSRERFEQIKELLWIEKNEGVFPLGTQYIHTPFFQQDMLSNRLESDVYLASTAQEADFLEDIVMKKDHSDHSAFDVRDDVDIHPTIVVKPL